MLAQIKAARVGAAKLRRARRVARFDAWCTAIFACLTVVGSVLDPWGLLVAGALGAIAGVEFYGERLLRRLEERGPRVLGWNQLAFAGLLIAYAVWNLYPALGSSAAGGATSNLQAVAAGDPQVEAMVQNLERAVRLALYGSLIVIAVLVQGGTALYYFTRAHHLRAYVEETPEWVRQLGTEGGLEL
jgi:hypothetical protein